MIHRLSILILTALAGSAILSATEQSGSVRAADQMIPGATVTATQGEQKVTAYTNDAGRYTMDLAPGAWDIQVQMFGFTVVRKQVTIGADPSRVDWTMEMPRAGENGDQAAKPGAAAATTSAANPTTALTPPAQIVTPTAGGRGRGNGNNQQNAGRGNPAQAANPQAAAANGRGGNNAAAGRGGRGPQQGNNPQGFRQADVAATADGQQALAAAGSNALPELSLDTLDANTISGSVSGGLSQSFDDEAQRQRFQQEFQGRGGRGGPDGFPGNFNDFNADALGLGALGANAFNAGFSDGLGGGGFPGGQDGGRGGRGGRGGGGPGGQGGNFQGGNNNGGGGRGRGGNNGGGRGGRGGNNNNFNNFGNGRRNQPRYNGNIQLQLNNSNLNAAPFSLNGQQVIKPSTNSERLNVTFGGPLIIPKLVNLPRTQFTLTYTGNWSDGGNSSFGNVPTEDMRNGLFTQTLSNVPILLYDPKSDPLNRSPLAGNQIPKTYLDPAAAALLQFIPHPTFSTGLIQNYHLTTNSPSHSNSIGVRFNVPITNKDRLNFNIQSQFQSSTNQQLFGWDDTTSGTGMSANVQYSHSFASRIQNQITTTFSRNNSRNLPFFAYGTNLAGQLGITGTSQDPINFGPPTLSFTNFSGLSDGTASVPRSQTMNVSDTLSYTAKKVHNLQFGAGYVRQQQNSLTNAGARGSFTFSGNATSLLDANGNPVRGTGYDFADFLMGLAQSTSIKSPVNDYYRGWNLNSFAQDDWRVSRTLSVQFGIRYEYFAPWTEKYGRLANLDYSSGANAVTLVTPGQTSATAGSLPDSLVFGDGGNWSPRIGFAWRPFKKDSTVLRGGYSRVYSGSSYQSIVQSMGSQPPYTRSQATSANWLNGQLLTFPNGFPVTPNQLTNNYSIDPHFGVADAQTWNLSVAHDLPSALLLEVSAQHIKGTHLGIVEQPNRLINNVYAIPGASSFNYQTDGANSLYNGVQTTLTRRFSQGFSSTVAYTYSVALDNASSFNGVGGSAVQYLNNWNLERGLSATDQRHRVTVQFQMTSPVGRRGRLSNRGLKTEVLGGWTLQGNFTAASGTPLTPTVAGNLSNIGGNGALGATSRADATGVSVAGIDGQYFNPLAFTTPAAGQFGNAGKSTIPGLFQTSLNASLNRSFRLGEGRKQLQFQLQTNNALNHVVITRFGTVVGSSTYDVATGASGTRRVTLQLRFQF